MMENPREKNNEDGEKVYEKKRLRREAEFSFIVTFALLLGVFYPTSSHVFLWISVEITIFLISCFVYVVSMKVLFSSKDRPITYTLGMAIITSEYLMAAKRCGDTIFCVVLVDTKVSDWLSVYKVKDESAKYITSTFMYTWSEVQKDYKINKKHWKPAELVLPLSCIESMKSRSMK